MARGSLMVGLSTYRMRLSTSATNMLYSACSRCDMCRRATALPSRLSVCTSLALALRVVGRARPRRRMLWLINTLCGWLTARGASNWEVGRSIGCLAPRLRRLSSSWTSPLAAACGLTYHTSMCLTRWPTRLARVVSWVCPRSTKVWCSTTRSRMTLTRRSMLGSTRASCPCLT